MRWDEYVEDVTEGIPDRRRAREIRRELRDHLECAAEAGLAEGLSRPQAEDRALATLGPGPVLARQFRLTYPDAPLWPAVAAILAALSGVALILWPATDQQPGISAGLLIWSAFWATGHPKSFLSLVRRPWPRVSPRHPVSLAWPFAAAGVLTAGALVCLLNGGIDGVAIASLPLFPLVAWALWEGANALCRQREAVHPVGSGLGALALLVTSALTWLIAPQLGPASFSLGQTWAQELPWAMLLAVLYLTGAAVLANVHALLRSHGLDRVGDTLIRDV